MVGDHAEGPGPTLLMKDNVNALFLKKKKRFIIYGVFLPLRGLLKLLSLSKTEGCHSLLRSPIPYINRSKLNYRSKGVVQLSFLFF
jgi:hypothetical protein